MQHHELAAPRSLRHSIRDFWYWDMDLGAAASPFEVMPDGHAEIVFHFGDGCDLVHKGVATPLPSPYIVGLLKHPVYFAFPGRLQIIGIKCLPWAVYELLDLPSVKGGVQSFTHPIATLQTALAVLRN